MTRRRKTKDTDVKSLRDSFLFKFSSKILLSLLVVVVFLTLIQCTVKKPEAPTWTTNLTVPVVNRTYPMEEIISMMDQEGLIIDEDSNIIYTFTEEIDTVTIDQVNLTIDDISVTPFSEQLGVVEIDAPARDSVTVSLDEIAPLALGAGIPIPETTFTVTNNLPALDGFTAADIVTGAVAVIIANDLGLTVDSVVVKLLDAGNGDALVDSNMTAAPIPTGSSGTVPLSLDGKTVSNTLKIEATCFTGGGGPFLETAGLEITSILDFPSQLSVSAAYDVTVPPLTRDFSTATALQQGGETDLIHNATLDGGNLQLSIVNNSQLDASVTVSLPDLKQASLPFSTLCDIGPGIDTVLNINIAGYSLEPTDITLPQLIDINVSAEANDNGLPIDVHATDSFQVGEIEREYG